MVEASGVGWYGEKSFGCCDGGEVRIHRKGVLEDHDETCECEFCGYQAKADKCAVIDAQWDQEDGYSWTYKTDIPHATFEVMEDGEHYCRGLVIDINDLPEL